MEFNKKKPAGFFSLEILFIIFLTLGSGCNEDPTVMGYSFVKDTISITAFDSDELNIITKVENKYEPYAGFNNGRVNIGRSEQTWAVSLLRFGDIPDSLGDITIERIDEAKLYLHPTGYALGDTSDAHRFGFKIYRNQRIYTNQTIWDSLFPGGSLESSPYIDYRKVVGSHEGIVQFKGDTVPDVEIDLDKDMIVNWFQKGADSVLSEHHYGISLIPEEFSNVIIQFANFDTDLPKEELARVKIYYYDENDVRKLITMYSGADLTVVKAPEPDSGSFIVQGGVRYSTLLYFDINSLPDFAGIHRAQLELWPDMEKSKIGSNGLDKYLSLVLVDQEGYSSDVEVVKTGTLQDDGKYLFPDMNFFFEVWLRRSRTGIVELKPQQLLKEISQEMDRIVFHGFDSKDVDKRPKLKIIYSTRPKYSDEK